MKLSREEVEHIAQLAHLKLSEDEKIQYAEQLSDILEYAARLNELDTEEIPPTARVLDRKLRLRADQSLPGLSTQEVLKNSPESRDGQFKVPPVLGE